VFPLLTEEERFLYPCKKCKKLVHPSNLIQTNTCLYCFEKKVRQSTFGLKKFKAFSSIYFYLPFFSSIGSLLIFFFVPYTIQALVLDFFAVFIIVISLITAFPYVNPSMLQMAEDRSSNYQKYINEYNPQSAEFCAKHPDIPAIARCSICFKPYCAHDLCFTNLKIPTDCRYCVERYLNSNLSATIYYIFALAPIIILTILNGVFYGFQIDVIIFFFAPFIIFFLPLGVYLTKRTMLSKSAPESYVMKN